MAVRRRPPAPSQQITKIALSHPVDPGLPFSTWSLAELAESLVAEGVVDNISHERASPGASSRGGVLSSAEDLGTLHRSRLRGRAEPGLGALRHDRGQGGSGPRATRRWRRRWTLSARSTCCLGRTSTGRRNLPPRRRNDGSPRRRRNRATYSRTEGAWHLLAALEMNADHLYGHLETTTNRTKFLEFCRYLRSLYPPEVRIAVVMDNSSPHLWTRTDSPVGDWAAANDVELAWVPTTAGFLDRLACHFTALHHFAPNGTDHQTHEEQNSMIRRSIAWRSRHEDDEALRAMSERAKVA